MRRRGVDEREVDVTGTALAVILTWISWYGKIPGALVMEPGQAPDLE